MQQNARNRLGPQMIALFGSVLNPAVRAHDVDVVYSRVTPEEARRAALAWCRTHRPEMIDAQGHCVIDLHEAEWLPAHGDQIPARFRPLQAVEESDPVLALMGPAPAVTVAYHSLPRAVRYFARHGRLPDEMRLRLGVDGREVADSYFGGGLAALRTAWVKIRHEDHGQLYDLLGPVFRVLLARDPMPTEIERIAKGFPGGGGAGLDWWLWSDDERWHAGTTHGPETELGVDRNGMIVPLFG